jgi:hypothetical protein
VNQEVLYLGLVILSLSLFWRVYEQGRGWRGLGVGLVLALLAKELAVLLAPALLLFLLGGERGRRLLARRELHLVLAAFAGAALLILLYAIRHPGPAESNLDFNLVRLLSLGVSVEPLEFFLRPSTRYDMPLADAWRYPCMFRVTGILLLAGVVASLPRWRQDFVRLLLTVFGFYFLFFTFVGHDPGRTPPHSGEFWWVDVALIPAIVLTAGGLVELARRSGRIRRIAWILPTFLIADALFFAAITKNGPVLRWLGTTYEEVAARLPFLF